MFLISAYASNDFFNNLRGNQLPAALKESHVSVNKYINPLKRMQRRCIGEQKKKKIVEKIIQARFMGVPVGWYLLPTPYTGSALLTDDSGVLWESFFSYRCASWDGDRS